jgi:hypothetical protein
VYIHDPLGSITGSSLDVHPAKGADIGQPASGSQPSSLTQYAGHAYRVKVLSRTGEWGPQGSPWTAPPGGLTPSCQSCHKAHGNQNPDGLILLSGTGPLTEEGDLDGVAAGLTSLCAQCHEGTSGATGSGRSEVLPRLPGP